MWTTCNQKSLDYLWQAKDGLVLETLMNLFTVIQTKEWSAIVFFVVKLRKGDWVKAPYNISERDGTLIYWAIPRINHGKDVVFKHVLIHGLHCFLEYYICTMTWIMGIIQLKQLYYTINDNKTNQKHSSQAQIIYVAEQIYNSLSIRTSGRL